MLGNCCAFDQLRHIGLKPALKPLIDQIEQINAQIEVFNEQIEEVTEETFPETQALVQVPGARSRLSPSCLPGDKHRFQKSRDVGSYIGLSDCGLGALSLAAMIHS